MTLPPVLDVQAVQARYGVRDPRSARRVMRAAGGFLVAGRLVVRADDLDAHERAQAAEARRVAETGAPDADPAGAGLRRPPLRPPPAPRVAPLAPGWWRDTAEGG